MLCCQSIATLVVVCCFMKLFGRLFYKIFCGLFKIGRIDIREKWGNTGYWAVVTGATDGIGKAYAFALAKRGLNILLVSRNEEKLKKVSREIEEKCGIMTKFVTIDFTDQPEVYEGRLRSEIEGLPHNIVVLVNNVGMSYEFANYFLDIPNRSQLCKDIVNCNITSLNTVTSVVLPFMTDGSRTVETKGIIINVGSMSSTVAMPMLTVYAASKAYVEHFSACLESEYSLCGIVVQCVTAALVTTKLSGVRRKSLFAPSPEAWVESAINRVGVFSCTYGYWSHDIQGLLPFIIPNCIIIKFLTSVHVNVRDKAIAKKSKLEKNE